MRPPVWLTTPLYIGLGWIAAFAIPELLTGAGVAAVVLAIVGGGLYTAGGVVYATSRPDPAPTVFGFHEVFHALTLAAFATQYVAVSLVVYAAGARDSPPAGAAPAEQQAADPVSRVPHAGRFRPPRRTPCAAGAPTIPRHGQPERDRRDDDVDRHERGAAVVARQVTSRVTRPSTRRPPRAARQSLRAQSKMIPIRSMIQARM